MSENSSSSDSEENSLQEEDIREFMSLVRSNFQGTNVYDRSFNVHRVSPENFKKVKLKNKKKKKKKKSASSQSSSPNFILRNKKSSSSKLKLEKKRIKLTRFSDFDLTTTEDESYTSPQPKKKLRKKRSLRKSSSKKKVKSDSPKMKTRKLPGYIDFLISPSMRKKTRRKVKKKAKVVKYESGVRNSGELKVWRETATLKQKRELVEKMISERENKEREREEKYKKYKTGVIKKKKVDELINRLYHVVKKEEVEIESEKKKKKSSGTSKDFITLNMRNLEKIQEKRGIVEKRKLEEEEKLAFNVPQRKVVEKSKGTKMSFLEKSRINEQKRVDRLDRERRRKEELRNREEMSFRQKPIVTRNHSEVVDDLFNWDKVRKQKLSERRSEESLKNVNHTYTPKVNKKCHSNVSVKKYYPGENQNLIPKKEYYHRLNFLQSFEKDGEDDDEASDDDRDSRKLTIVKSPRKRKLMFVGKNSKLHKELQEEKNEVIVETKIKEEESPQIYTKNIEEYIIEMDNMSKEYSKEIDNSGLSDQDESSDPNELFVLSEIHDSLKVLYKESN